MHQRKNEEEVVEVEEKCRIKLTWIDVIILCKFLDILIGGTGNHNNRAPVLYIDCMFIGMRHQWHID